MPTHAFVISKFDYGKALLNGIPYNSMSRLQYVQNFEPGKLIIDHVRFLFIKLHWLPVTTDLRK